VREEAVQAIGVVLIIFGAYFFLASFDVGEQLAVEVYSITKPFPMSVQSAQGKISDSLEEALRTAAPEEKVPVVIMLTAPSGAMAIAQQQVVLPELQTYGFELRGSVVYVSNALIGRIPAKSIDSVAANPYVRAIYYDMPIANITADVFSVNLLKESVPMIGAPEVWKQGYTGQGVVLVIIDSGVQNTHPWLMRNGKTLVIKEVDIVPGATDYTHWHGTHCAGIVASQDSTYRGVAPGIDGIIDILAFDWSGSASFSWVLKALDEAYKSAKEIKKFGKAVVFTNSWGTVPKDKKEINELRRAVLKLTELGPVVFAAGNSGPGSGTINAPGDADANGVEVITVGAVDKNGVIAEFSSRGPDKWGEDHAEPDISAPGVDIVSSVPGGKVRAKGTSMATPHVAGVIALMLSKNPNLTNMEALKILMETAVDKGPSGFDYAYGAGIVNAAKAVAHTPSAVPSTPSAPVQVTQIAALLALFVGVLLIANPRIIGA